jgi:peptide/nickel transport system ATP-binding protein
MSQTVRQHGTDHESAVLSIDSLDVEYKTKGAPVKALRDVSITINRGEILGVAGESGSGKSTLALAILRYLGKAGRVKDGDIIYNDENILELSKKDLQSIRGNEIAHVPQDPKTSLNPSMRVGKQIKEVIQTHRDVSSSEADQQVLAILREVNIPEVEFNAKRYPHELSGGMQQRILLAMALACQPNLLILDEPTTGLDVTTQAKILDLVDELVQDRDTSVLLITHDLGVIAQIADRVNILYAGEVMETGAVEEVFNRPANPYTQGLLSSLPKKGAQKRLNPIKGQVPSLMEIPDGCIFADRCELAEEECRTGTIDLNQVDDKSSHQSRCRRLEYAVENPIDTGEESRPTAEYSYGEKILSVNNLKKYYGEGSFLPQIFGEESPVKAVNGVNFDVFESETLGIVGESGCGKSTLGSMILNLIKPTEGSVSYRGNSIDQLEGTALREFRSECQIVFQNPHSSLNPKKTIGSTLERPLKMFTEMDEQARVDRILELLDQVGLDQEYLSRYPKDLSGGEKQRIAIARAFSVNPSLVVLDEPVSALDVSVQASVLNLLADLKEEYGTSYVLISHDLSVVNHISDRVAVMYLGKFVEKGPTEAIFNPPHHPYTRGLLSSILSPDPTESKERIYLEGDVPSARDPPSGCEFHTRCPQKIGQVCEAEEPALESMSDDESHRISCHLEEAEMGYEGTIDTES